MKGKILVTGGTGSFGHTVVNRFLMTEIKEIRILSRDEKKQDDMRHFYQELYPEYSSKIKFYIGDVRDYNSIIDAFRGNRLQHTREEQGQHRADQDQHGHVFRYVMTESLHLVFYLFAGKVTHIFSISRVTPHFSSKKRSCGFSQLLERTSYLSDYNLLSFMDVDACES